MLPKKIFCCYAHEDEPLLNKLKKHLRPLQRQDLIDLWYDGDISAGTEWEQEIKQHLNTAEIILLLISPDFMNSDYCYGIEMQRAIERHERGEATVIPVILRSIYWQGAPFGKLQALPKDGKAIISSSWHNPDEAFHNVAEGIRKTIGVQKSVATSFLTTHQVTISLKESNLLSQQSLQSSNASLNQRKIFKIFLYFIGVFVAAFGLTGTMIEINFTFLGGCIAICLGLGSLLGGIIVFSRTYRYLQDLSWFQYTVWLLGVAIIVCMAFLLVVILYKSDIYLARMFFYSIYLFYGFTLIWLAYKKPALSQQVSESVQNILEAMPNKQISVPELMARLQRMHRLPDTTLYQYIWQLKYIEQINIPGTNTKIVLMRRKKQELAFPQVAMIANSTLRANIERALSDFTEERVDIGLFLLGREFETTLKAFLIKAHAKGKLPITPGNKKPDQMKLVEMISCLKNNKIVTDEAALSYLRQQRDDRAHGGTPTLAERSLIMKNAQLLASLYIDYIKWFDDLYALYDV